MTPENGFRMLRDDAVWHPYGEATDAAPVVPLAARRPVRVAFAALAAVAVVALAVAVGVGIRGWQASRQEPPVASTPTATPATVRPELTTASTSTSIGVPVRMSGTGFAPSTRYMLFTTRSVNANGGGSRSVDGTALAVVTTDASGAFSDDVFFDADDARQALMGPVSYYVEIAVDTSSDVSATDLVCSSDCQTPVPGSNAVLIAVEPPAADAPRITASTSQAELGKPVTLSFSGLAPDVAYSVIAQFSVADQLPSFGGGSPGMSQFVRPDADGSATTTVVVEAPEGDSAPPALRYRIGLYAGDDANTPVASVEVVFGRF